MDQLGQFTSPGLLFSEDFRDAVPFGTFPMNKARDLNHTLSATVPPNRCPAKVGAHSGFRPSDETYLLH